MAKLKGVDETIRRMKKFSNDAQNGIIDAMDVITSKVLTDAQDIVPVDIGKLKESGRRAILRKRVWFTGRVGFHTRYAYYVEFGTSKMSAQPYLWPAVTKNRELILEKLGRHMEHAIEKNDYERKIMRRKLI